MLENRCYKQDGYFVNSYRYDYLRQLGLYKVFITRCDCGWCVIAEDEVKYCCNSYVKAMIKASNLLGFSCIQEFIKTVGMITMAVISILLVFYLFIVLYVFGYDIRSIILIHDGEVSYITFYITYLFILVFGMYAAFSPIYLYFIGWDRIKEILRGDCCTDTTLLDPEPLDPYFIKRLDKFLYRSRFLLAILLPPAVILETLNIMGIVNIYSGGFIDFVIHYIITFIVYNLPIFLFAFIWFKIIHDGK